MEGLLSPLHFMGPWTLNTSVSRMEVMWYASKMLFLNLKTTNYNSSTGEAYHYPLVIILFAPAQSSLTIGSLYRTRASTAWSSTSLTTQCRSTQSKGTYLDLLFLSSRISWLVQRTRTSDRLFPSGSFQGYPSRWTRILKKTLYLRQEAEAMKFIAANTSISSS